MDIESPCINLCFLEDGLCQGCFRTEDEIVSWMLMTDQERGTVMKRLHERIREERST